MAITAQNVKVEPGYKQTEVGVIPEDWQVKNLGEVCNYQNGTSLEKYFNRYQGLNVISIGNYSPDGKYIDSHTYIEWIYYRNIRRFVLCNNDLCMKLNDKTSIGAIIGRVLLIKEDNKYVFNQRSMRLTPYENISSLYLYYVINSDLLHNKIVSLAKPGTQIYVNTGDVTGLTIPVPKFPEEQTAIATVLLELDSLIESLDKFIAKKRDIKQATMQQLLTGKRRLRGFGGKWILNKFEQIATVRKEKVDPRRSGGHSFCVELEHIGQGSGRLIGYSTATEASSLKSRFNIGDVLFGRLRAYLRKYWLADRDGVCSTEIWPFVPKGDVVIGHYLFQLIQANQFIEAASTAYGTHMPRTDWNVIKNYEVSLPFLNEQQAIATVLTDMDAEIWALEQKRDKTRALKQAMMQELLTGKTRLV